MIKNKEIYQQKEIKKSFKISRKKTRYINSSPCKLLSYPHYYFSKNQIKKYIKLKKQKFYKESYIFEWTADISHSANLNILEFRHTNETFSGYTIFKYEIYLNIRELNIFFKFAGKLKQIKKTTFKNTEYLKLLLDNLNKISRKYSPDKLRSKIFVKYFNEFSKKINKKEKNESNI